MPVIENTKTDYHEYIYHEAENYHEFIAHESTRRIVETYMDLTYKLTEKTLAGELPPAPIRVLIDFSTSKMFPLQTLYALYRKFLEKHPNAPYGRIAYITKDAGLDSVVGNSFSTVPNRSHSHQSNQRKFFRPEQRQEAIAWLLSDD